MRKFVVKLSGGLSAMAGVAVLGYVIVPIVSFRVDSSTRFSNYLSPVPIERIFANAPDYTKASNWFDGVAADFEATPTNVRYYNLSIPRLNIVDAVVAIGGEDLSEYLIQYPGTALPGKRGNSVIFGHSILPQFYNPKDYMAVFSTLPTMKKGDRIEIKYDGMAYSYIVDEMFEVSPTDLEILAQNITDSYITLVTCTPPGHPLRPRRLIVRAKLDPSATLSDNGQNPWN